MGLTSGERGERTSLSIIDNIRGNGGVSRLLGSDWLDTEEGESCKRQENGRLHIWLVDECRLDN